MLIKICVQTQLLYLFDEENSFIKKYSVSTAKNGVGEAKGSEKTPRGEHVIYSKIGENHRIFTIFRARVAADEPWIPSMQEGDFILSRILWLVGEQTPLDRYIYIHGTHDEANIGTPNSHGCVRMKNEDVIDLFDRVSEGDRVFIKEEL